jgi:uncharacterized OB-fold protein
MKHLPLSLWTLCTLVACDAAVVASAQQDEPAAPAAVELQKVEHSEKAAEDAAAAVKVDADVKATIKPEVLDLESINFLVKKGKVKDAAALEKKINDPKEKLNTVDVDGDGKIDKIQVVEIQKPNQAKVFELHVIPSKTKKKEDEVIIAFIHFEPDVETKKLVVKATYAPIVIGYDTIVYEYFVPIEVKGETIVVVDTHPFYGWLFLPARPVFVGVYVYSAPPPPVIIIEHGWHHKHKHKGKGKGKWH